MTYNANWTEWSAILVWIHTSDLKKRTGAQREFDLKSHVRFQIDQNCLALSSIITLLHPFFNCKIQSLKYRIFLSVQMFYWSSTELCKSCLLSSSNLIGFFKQALRFDWLLCFGSVPHWLGKRCDLEQKIIRFVNKSQRWEPIRLQGSPEISKWI